MEHLKESTLDIVDMKKSELLRELAIILGRISASNLSLSCRHSTYGTSDFLIHKACYQAYEKYAQLHGLNVSTANVLVHSLKVSTANVLVHGLKVSEGEA